MSDQGVSSTGLQANLAGLLCYILGPITGLVFILIERSNGFVRFHAWQALFTFGGLLVVSVVLSLLRFIPLLPWLLSLLLSFVALVLWIVMMVKAYQGERFALPVVGELAEKQASAPPPLS